MNKSEFIAFFNDHIATNIPKDDKPMLRQAWNDTIDGMVKGNELNKRARNWAHPKSFA